GRGADPGRRHDGRGRDRIGVVGGLDAADARVGTARDPLELDRQLDLAVRGHVDERRSVQVELRDRHAVGLGQPRVLVGCGEAGVVARLGQCVRQHIVVERAGVGEPHAVVTDDPHPHAAGLGRRELLDISLVRADLRVARVHDDCLDLLAVGGPPDDAVADRQQFVELGAHAAVPPIVSAVTRNVGTPSPTGTPWPSLPHMPGGPIATALPTASTWVSTCGPLPMRLPSRSGSVISPLWIRYASVMPNTKSPVAVFTWPPPSAFTYTPRSVDAMMSAGSSLPASTYVFVVRTIGRCW